MVDIHEQIIEAREEPPVNSHLDLSLGQKLLGLRPNPKSFLGRALGRDEYPKVGGQLGRVIRAQLEEMEQAGGPFLFGGKTKRGRWRDAADAVHTREILRAAASNLGDLLKKPFRRG